jgi:DNA-binding PadR family transcriptional regulator
MPMSVRHALLALLSEGPKYGLRLQQEFHANTGNVWPLNAGQVYTTLQRLERDDLLSAEGQDEGPQKLYRITEAGTAELHTWLESTAESMPPPRDELVIKVLVARTVSDVDLTQLLQRHRRQTVELMQQYGRLKADAKEHEIELLLILDAELFKLEAIVHWIDSVDARMQQKPQFQSAKRPDVAGTESTVVRKGVRK